MLQLFAPRPVEVPEGVTRETMPVVPAGMVRIAEYGSYPKAFDADVTTLEEAVGALHGYPKVRLQHSTRGYECAGSQARWTEAYWAVRWDTYDGAIHGKRFAEEDEAKAREYFAHVTDPQRVSAKRQEDAWLEETCYKPAREKRAREEAERAAAERERKNALARMRRARRRVA